MSNVIVFISFARPQHKIRLQMNQQTVKIYSALLAAMIFWSISFIWTKSLLSVFEPITLIAVRLLISTLLLFLVAKGNHSYQMFKKQDWASVFTLALFNPFLYFIGENYAMKYVSPTVAAVFIATIPLFTPMAAYMFLKERLTSSNYLGIVVSVIGVLLVIVKKDLSIDIHPKGIFFLLLAVSAAVVYSLLIKKLSKKYSPVNLTIYQNGIGFFYFIPILLLLEFSSLSRINFSTDIIFPLLGLSIFCSSVAFVFFAYGAKHISISRANVFTNVIPIFTAFFSFVFFDERLSFYQLWGIVFVIFGLFLSQLSKRREQVSPQG